MKLHAGLTSAVLALCALCAGTGASAKDAEKLFVEDIKKFDDCVYQSVFSFLLPDAYPPRSRDELRKSCARQTEGFKCLKERTKGSSPIIRRGLVTLTGTRGRQHKRLCPNLDSDFSKKYTAGAKCLLDARLEQLAANDLRLVSSFGEILRRNYNDSAAELKQFCCALFSYRKIYFDIAQGACPDHKEAAEEIMAGVVTEDISLICEDEDKLAKTCAKLDKVFDKVKVPGPLAPGQKVDAGASTALYIIATLGEADASQPSRN